MYIFYNPNPTGQFVGDCVIRAITKATGKPWDDVYLGIALQGFAEKNMPSANKVWGNYLRKHGFIRHNITGVITVKGFCEYNPLGLYVLGTGTHVVTVENGNYFDAWDSGQEIPIYYFERC